jgi:Endonuclease/Exonuclease/phosphatase family.
MFVRIATFNLENLFARYDFGKAPDPTRPDGITPNPDAFLAFGEVDRQITAQTIGEVNADIIGLQEVENLLALDTFAARCLPMMQYKHRILIDGFDSRRINVAILSRYPIMGVRSYRNERNKAGTRATFGLSAPLQITRRTQSGSSRRLPRRDALSRGKIRRRANSLGGRGQPQSVGPRAGVHGCGIEIAAIIAGENKDEGAGEMEWIAGSVSPRTAETVYPYERAS